MNNRELKFRAWDSRTKKWLFGYEYPNLGGFSMKGEVVGFGEYSNFLKSIPIEDWGKIILMQYIELKDKNGKEIYDGDILQKSKSLGIDRKPHNFRPMVGGIKKVLYHDGRFVLSRSNSSTRYPLNSFMVRFYGLEVVGNIYQNPELLTQ